MRSLLMIIGVGALIIAGCGKKENKDPLLTSPQDLVVAENADFQYQATAGDPENHALTINYLDYPDWLSILNNQIRGRAPWGLAETTLFGFNVLVSDGYNDVNFPVRIKVYPGNDFYLSFYPQQRQMAINHTTSFTIGLNNVQDLFGISFDVLCDTTYLRITDVEVPIHNLFETGGIYFYHSIPGGVSVFIGRTQTPDNDNIHGGGPLATISLRGMTVGMSSIGFYNVMIVDENGSPNNNIANLYRGSASVYVRPN